MGILLHVIRWTGRLFVILILALASGYESAAVASTRMPVAAAVTIGSVLALLLLSLLVGIFLKFDRHGVKLEVAAVCFVASFAVWLSWDPKSPDLDTPLVPAVSDVAGPSRDSIAKGFKGGAWESWPPIFGEGSSLLRLSINKNDLEAYVASISESADEIDEAWARATDARAWVDEVNSHIEISDFVLRFDSPMLSFSNVRAISRLYAHRATRLALQGRGDEALDTLVALAEFAGRLRRGGRALVTVMMAVVVEGIVIDTAQLTLDRGETSPAARERLAAALDDGIWDGRDLARSFRAEHDMAAIQVVDLRREQFVDLMTAVGGDAPRVVRWMLGRAGGLFLFNPNRFCREHRELMTRLADCAERLDGVGIKNAEAEIEERFGHLPTKNPAGALLMQMMVPAFSKVHEASRTRLEQRRQLVATLRS